MEIADSVSCDLFEDDSYQGREASLFRIAEEKDNVSLYLESTRRGLADDLEIATTLDLQRVEPGTISHIHEKLGDWLASEQTEPVSWQTRPLDGEYSDSTSTEEVRWLEITISSDGIDIVGITPSGAPVEHAITIPPAEEIHNGVIDEKDYFQRTHSVLEIFLSGQKQATGDLLELAGHLVDPNVHFHAELPRECMDRFESGDYMGVVQKAGETLETYLDQTLPEEIAEKADTGADQARRAFNNEREGFLWGNVPSEQQGIQALYAGGFLAFRNPASHGRGDPERGRYLDDINKRDAIDVLCFFNFLIGKLDKYGQCELERDDSAWDL